jgi:molybdenum cofactor cytidylyltransferase
MSPLPGLLVLGAGLSQRFGEADKLGQDLGGRPLAHHALAALEGFDWAARVLVCRADTSWSDAYQATGFQRVINRQPENGMLWSLHLGVAQAVDCPAVMIALADMPLVTADHIRRLITRFDEGQGQAVATKGDGYLGPPAIFPRASLIGLPKQGEGGARSLLAEALPVPIEDRLRVDVDTPQALQQVRQRIV